MLAYGQKAIKQSPSKAQHKGVLFYVLKCNLFCHILLIFQEISKLFFSDYNDTNFEIFIKLRLDLKRSSYPSHAYENNLHLQCSLF